MKVVRGEGNTEHWIDKRNAWCVDFALLSESMSHVSGSEWFFMRATINCRFESISNSIVILTKKMYFVWWIIRWAIIIRLSGCESLIIFIVIVMMIFQVRHRDLVNEYFVDPPIRVADSESQTFSTYRNRIKYILMIAWFAQWEHKIVNILINTLGSFSDNVNVEIKILKNLRPLNSCNDVR